MYTYVHIFYVWYCIFLYTIINEYNCIPYPLPLFSAKLPEVTTTQEYTAIEGDELSVPNNTVVQVVKKSVTGWWTIKYNGKVGLFPAIYLQEEAGDRRVLQPQQRAFVPRK